MGSTLSATHINNKVVTVVGKETEAACSHTHTHTNTNTHLKHKATYHLYCLVIGPHCALFLAIYQALTRAWSCNLVHDSVCVCVCSGEGDTAR